MESKCEEVRRTYSKENPITYEEAEIILKDPSFPVPKQPHIVLSDDDIKGKTIFAIGDVHGCYDSLIALLKKADVYQDPNVLLVFVGDIINKGPKSCEVLDFVRSSNSLCIMGNHERSAVRKLRLMKWNVGYEPKPRKRWLHSLSESDCSYLQELPLTISIPSLNAIFVHGGLIQGKPLENHTQDELLLMRNVIVEEDGTLTSTKDSMKGVLWGSLWKGPQHVYFGHHAVQRLQQHPFATGLDTGCVYGGALTGVFVTGDKRLISVESVEPTENCEEVISS
ncbi:bis(5'-nucleosyl)-tetraphosphatase PrpE [asymmetrical]-like [Diadema setosum]|uniref:bis(5'-nucleosyl)-tetraphosphatase PrpE [asymmetrical]-like n=1 Tax=Diadema setosum TaxID=31175 RepID=UPI003B3A133B